MWEVYYIFNINFVSSFSVSCIVSVFHLTVIVFLYNFPDVVNFLCCLFWGYHIKYSFFSNMKQHKKILIEFIYYITT